VPSQKCPGHESYSRNEDASVPTEWLKTFAVPNYGGPMSKAKREANDLAKGCGQPKLQPDRRVCCRLCGEQLLPDEIDDDPHSVFVREIVCLCCAATWNRMMCD